MAKNYITNNRDYNHPYLKRTICRDSSLDFPQQHNEYTLLSLAKNDINGIDIFLLYFPSYFKSTSGLNAYGKIYELVGVKLEHFSYFFKVFVEIYALKYVIFAREFRTDVMKGVLQELIGQQRTHVINQLSFEKALKVMVTDVLQRPKYKPWMSKQNNFNHIQEIQKEIKDILNRFNASIDDKYFMQNLRNSEIFFDYWRENNIQIKRSMKTISKIKCLHSHAKRIIWYNFYEDNKYFLEIKFPWIEDGYKRDKNINTIILKNRNQQKDYIYMKFSDYLKNIHETKWQKENINFILKQFVQCLLNICKQYHKKTNQYFPNLSLDDIFINQKTLLPFFAPHNLMLSYLGLDHSIKTPQIRISSQATPKGIDKQLSYFEVDPENEQKMKKKFYFYNNNDMKKGEEYRYIKEYRQTEQLLENIHAWRVLNIIRYIEQGAFIIQDYYNRKLCPYREKMKEINQQLYVQQLKNLKNDLQTGIIKQNDLFPILNTIQKDNFGSNKQNSNSTEQQREYFQFTFNELQDQFNNQRKDDSFLCNNFLKMRMRYYNRAVILKQINSRFSERQLFKSIPNPLKYHFVYCLNAYQLATKQLQFLQKQREKRYQQSQFPKQSQQKLQQPSFRDTLQQQFDQLIEGISISKQFITRSKINKNIIKKLKQYNNRSPDQRYRKYNQADKNKIDTKVRQIDQINKDFIFLNKCRRLMLQKNQNASRRLERVKQIIKQTQNKQLQRFDFIKQIFELEKNREKDNLDKVLYGLGETVQQKCEQLLSAIKKIVTDCGVVVMMQKYMGKEQKTYNGQQLESIQKIYKNNMVAFIMKLFFMFERDDIVAQTILSTITTQLKQLPQSNEEKKRWYIYKTQYLKQISTTFFLQNQSRIPLLSQQLNNYDERAQQQFYSKFRPRVQQNLQQTFHDAQQREYHTKY